MLPSTSPTEPTRRPRAGQGRGAKEPPIVIEVKPVTPKKKPAKKKRTKTGTKKQTLLSIGEMLDDVLALVERGDELAKRGDELAERIHTMRDKLRALWLR